MYSSVQIGDRIIKLGKEKGVYFTNIQLNRLVYYAQGVSLLFDSPLTYNYAYAWNWGPVFPTLYSRFGHNGDSLITAESGEYFHNCISDGHDNIIMAIIDSYSQGAISMDVISNCVFDSRSPWSKAWNRSKYSIISPQSMKDYFKMISSED